VNQPHKYAARKQLRVEQGKTCFKVLRYECAYEPFVYSWKHVMSSVCESPSFIFFSFSIYDIWVYILHV